MRVIFDREHPEELPGLFAPGEAWLRAAQAWAAEQGQKVERWAIDRRVLVGGRWYAIAWNEEAGEGLDRGQWQVKALDG